MGLRLSFLSIQCAPHYQTICLLFTMQPPATLYIVAKFCLVAFSSCIIMWNRKTNIVSVFPFCLHLHWIFSNFLTLRNIRFNTFFASTKVQCACPGGIALVINAPSALNYFALHWILMQKKHCNGAVEVFTATHQIALWIKLWRALC